MSQVKKKVKRYKVVLGSLYGDEGKGCTVQWLCKKELDEGKKPLVVRFSGGAQAAHTIMKKEENGKDIRHICSSLGSGVLYGIDTYLDENFFLDPIMLMEEIDTLLIELAEAGSALGKSFFPKVWINDWCRIVTPYDIIANRKDQKIKEHGTTGKGIFTTHTRYSREFGLNPLQKISVKNSNNRVSSIFENPQEYLDRVKIFYGYPQQGELKDLCWEIANDTKISTIEELDWKFCDAIERIKHEIELENIKIREEDFYRSGLYDTIIYEGSQGLLLDAENGFDPWTTASFVGLNGIPRAITKGDNAYDVDVYLVMRTTLTRHGMGQFENHFKYEQGSKYFREIIKDNYEYNDVNDNQGHFYNTVFNIGILDRAIDRHRLDNYPVRYHLVITHADVIDKYVSNSSSEHPDFKEENIFWSYRDKNMAEHTRLFPVIDRDGTIKEVCNIHEFKKLIIFPSSDYLTHSMLANKWNSKKIVECWYSDNPYSEFKRC